MSPEERIKQLRRCYSIYLWAYTVSVSGGPVHFDLDDESTQELGVDVTFAHQRAAAMGAKHAKPYPGNAPPDPFNYAGFLSQFVIEDSKSVEPQQPPTEAVS
jgi:hypothetical protein